MKKLLDFLKKYRFTILMMSFVGLVLYFQSPEETPDVVPAKEMAKPLPKKVSANIRVSPGARASVSDRDQVVRACMLAGQKIGKIQAKHMTNIDVAIVMAHCTQRLASR